jgi:hypothetical protein
LVHLVSRGTGSFGFLGCSTGSSVGFLLLSVATAYDIVESVTTTTNVKKYNHNAPETILMKRNLKAVMVTSSTIMCKTYKTSVTYDFGNM